MAETKYKQEAPKPIRWKQEDWDWLKEIADALGQTRSEFIRQSALTAAKALAVGLPPYSVGVEKSTPQNTAPNTNRKQIAEQVVGEFLVGEESFTIIRSANIGDTFGKSETGAVKTDERQETKRPKGLNGRMA